MKIFAYKMSIIIKYVMISNNKDRHFNHCDVNDYPLNQRKPRLFFCSSDITLSDMLIIII